ncbi:hypothetical protein ACM7TQ_16730 [Pseudomonas aeruginosa]
MNKANECSCPSGDGSLVHPCPAHPAVEQAGGDERDFQAEGAQEVPSPVSQEYDRHLISLLRKGEALPGHQEEAADEIERLRDWNDHLNNTVLPNILNPTFLMLMKGGERLLDLCTKDGEFIGVSLNDMKDVFDWMVTHARIAPDQAALAQPSPKCATCNGSKVVSTTDTDHNGDYIEAPCPKCGGTGEADSGGVHPWGEPVLIPCDCETEKAEAERPVVVARLYRSNDLTMTPFAEVQKPLPLPASDGTLTVDALMTVAQHERIVEARWNRAMDLMGEHVARISEKLKAERDAALARVAELERVLRVVVNAADHGSWPTTVMHGIEKVREVLAGSAPPVKAQPEETPGEILAAKLIETWVTKHGKPAPWSTAVEITALATNMPNDERDRLLALDDDVDAQAQHSVPEGWVQSLPLKDHQPCKPNEDRANGYTIPIYSRPVLVEEALRKLRAVLCDPIGNVVIDGSDGDREEVQRALGMLAAAPGKEGV